MQIPWTHKEEHSIDSRELGVISIEVEHRGTLNRLQVSCGMVVHLSGQSVQVFTLETQNRCCYSSH